MGALCAVASVRVAVGNVEVLGMDSLPAYSLWDTLVDLRKPRLAAFGLTPGDVRRKRCELRVARYAAAASERMVDPTLADDLSARRFRWEIHLDPAEEPPVERSRRHDGESAWHILDFFSFGWDELFGGLAIVVGAVFAVVGLILLVVWIPLHILRFVRRTRCRRAINQRHCPDCSYDLNGVEDAIEASELRGQHVGPVRCPECGSRWPLLPPPLRA